MSAYSKTYLNHKFEIVGARGKGWSISYKQHEVGYATTLKEANEVIHQVVGNGVGDKMLIELD